MPKMPSENDQLVLPYIATIRRTATYYSTGRSERDLNTAIEYRLNEVREMIRPHKNIQGLLGEERYAELRETIEKYQQMPVSVVRKLRRRRCKKNGCHFRMTVQLVIILLRGFQSTKRFYIDEEEMLKIRYRLQQMFGIVNNPYDYTMTSIGLSLQTALTTPPQYRRNTAIKEILWLLSMTRAFQNLFPAEMVREVARYVEYAKYEDGRIIASQGKRPDFFYYVIAGRASIIHEFHLSSGRVTKHKGYIRKGMTTDPEEMNMSWIRENTLVSKEHVEVLLLHKDTFKYLQHTTIGLPVEFLRSVKYLHDFQFDRLVQTPEAIDYLYYGPGQIVVQDSNRTNWLHIIKSGQVKVVRYQTVTDVTSRKINEDKKSDSSSRHTQNKLRHPLPSNNGYIYTDNPSNHLGPPADAINSFQSSSPVDPAASISDSTHILRLPEILRRSDSQTEAEGTAESADLNLNSNCDDKGNDTETSTLLNKMKQREERHKRKTFIVLDVLRARDIFGLDHLHPALASEPRGVCLISDGAEVIQINKRFFEQNADEGALGTIDVMCKNYMSEEEATQKLQDDESWKLYKAAVLQRTADETRSKLRRLSKD